MTPELLQAVKERIELGYSHDAIKDELRNAGHAESVIESVLQQATGGAPEVMPIPAAGMSTGATVATVLPSVSSLVANAFSFATSRLDLVAILAVPYVIFELLNYTDSFNLSASSPSNLLTIGAGLFGLLAFVIYVLAMVMLLFSVANKERSVSLNEAFNWASKHIWGIAWVYILTFLAVWGGFMLFIIPGIIVSGYLYFSQFVFVVEGKRGMEALFRSRDLVRGQWWSVAMKIGAIALIVFGIFFAIALVVGIVSLIASTENITNVVLAIAMQVMSAGATVFGFHVGMSLYQSLATRTPAATPVDTSNKWMYVVLILLGLTFPAVIGISALTLPNLNGAIDRTSDASLQMSLSSARSYAEIYYNTHGDSYEGVCVEIEPTVINAKYTDCVDSPTTWALSATVEATNKQSCVDSNGGLVTGGIDEVAKLCKNSESLYDELDTPTDPGKAKQRAADLRVETAPINTADLEYQTSLVSALQQQYVNNGYSYKGSCATVEASDLLIWALICHDSDEYFVYTYLDENSLEMACSDSHGNIAVQDSVPEEGNDCKDIPF